MKFNLTNTSADECLHPRSVELSTLEDLLAFAISEGHDLIVSAPGKAYGGDKSAPSIEVYDDYRE